MSQNTDYYQLVTSSPSSSSPSTSYQRSKRLSSRQTFLPTPSECSTTPSSIVSTVQNGSPPSPPMSPIVNDLCVTGLNGARDASAAAKIKDNGSSNGNHSQDKYGFTLDLSASMAKVRKEPNPSAISQFYQFEMNTNNEEDLHSPFELDVPLCEHQPLKKIQNEFLIDRMLKDDDQRLYRSPNPSACTTTLNHSSPLVTPSSDHRDVDALSDAGTYIIEDDGDIAQDDEPERDLEHVPDSNDPASASSSSVSSPFRRYVTTKRNRHGTFDIHGLPSPNVSVVNRPIVDSNPVPHDLSSPSSSTSSRHSSSSSSLLSFPAESDRHVRKEPEGASHHTMDDQSANTLVYTRQRPATLLQQKRPITPPQNPIKPAECFVISATFETKNSPLMAPRRRVEPPWKPKSIVPIDSTKESNVESLSRKSPASPPTTTRVNSNDPGKYSFRLQQQQPTPQEPKPQASNVKSAVLNAETRASLRPHANIQENTYASSPFQRNASVRQTMPANVQYHRGLSSSVTAAASTASSTNKYPDDPDEMLTSHPSLTKVYMNKSFALRRQRSNLVPSTAKPSPPQPQSQPQVQPSVPKSLLSRQMLKGTTSIPSASLMASSMSNNSGQTNRAVELRRARAQAKIEELAQRTRQQLQKTEHHTDVMSASWHSNASSGSKKEALHLRSNVRSTYAQIPSQKQDLSKTRTISSSSHHRSSSASPNPLGETAASSRYRKAMVSSVTDEPTYQKMNGSTYSEGERCDSLRDDGQRLAIKLIQLSSGILAKLKPNNTAMDNDSNVRELEQLVDKLQTVNRALSTIDASLTTATSDESLI